MLTPDVRVVHASGAPRPSWCALNRGYLRAWSGFAAKQARTGHPLTAAWLWAWGVVDVLDMAKSALRPAVAGALAPAAAKLRGLLEGSAAGLGRRW